MFLLNEISKDKRKRRDRKLRLLFQGQITRLMLGIHQQGLTDFFYYRTIFFGMFVFYKNTDYKLI